MRTGWRRPSGMRRVEGLSTQYWPRARGEETPPRLTKQAGVETAQAVQSLQSIKPRASFSASRRAGEMNGLEGPGHRAASCPGRHHWLPESVFPDGTRSRKCQGNLPAADL